MVLVFVVYWSFVDTSVSGAVHEHLHRVLHLGVSLLGNGNWFVLTVR